MRQHTRTAAGLTVAAAAVLLVGIPVTATAKPPQPAPTYTLGQEIVTASAPPSTNGPTLITVTCPGLKVVTGGGYSADEQVPISASAPLGANQWTVATVPFESNTGTPITAYAICVNPA